LTAAGAFLNLVGDRRAYLAVVYRLLGGTMAGPGLQPATLLRPGDVRLRL